MPTDLIAAEPLFDGWTLFHPAQLGSEDLLRAALGSGQLAGTSVDNVCEIAGRICYDSLGSGRPTDAYFHHIHEVGHYSIFEHAAMTFQVSAKNPEIFTSLLLALINRPGVYVDVRGARSLRLRVTINLRAILECFWKPSDLSADATAVAHEMFEKFWFRASGAAPEIFRGCAMPPHHSASHDLVDVCPVAPDFDGECWVSLYCSGSRGWSHELVRHGDSTAISQRSTRYVDETRTDWVPHPLITYFSDYTDPALRSQQVSLVQQSQEVYERTVNALQPKLMENGADRGTARKQARGAARGFLGNALFTEMVFSASVAEWKHILRMRASDAADAEIREWAVKALLALRKTRHGGRFSEFEIREARDGLGSVIVSAAHA